MSDSMVERVAEAMWQAEWARAGNGGRRKVPWSGISELDQERYRFVARAVLEVMEPKRTTVDDMLTEDLLLVGTSFEMRTAQGYRYRIPPEDIILKRAPDTNRSGEL